MLTILSRGDSEQTEYQGRGSLRSSAYHTPTPGSSISSVLTFGPALDPGGLGGVSGNRQV